MIITSQVPINLDINSGNPLGVGIVPVFEAHGYRTTSASANLKDTPKNLIIWTDATVGKIIFEGVRAIGVETTNGRKGTSNPTDDQRTKLTINPSLCHTRNHPNSRVIQHSKTPHAFRNRAQRSPRFAQHP